MSVETIITRLKDWNYALFGEFGPIEVCIYCAETLWCNVRDFLSAMGLAFPSGSLSGMLGMFSQQDSVGDSVGGSGGGGGNVSRGVARGGGTDDAGRRSRAIPGSLPPLENIPTASSYPVDSIPSAGTSLSSSTLLSNKDDDGGKRSVVRWGENVQPAFRQEQDYPPGWLVFDPAFGVIPHSDPRRMRNVGATGRKKDSLATPVGNHTNAAPQTSIAEVPLS